jgi:hypothetical protein
MMIIWIVYFIYIYTFLDLDEKTMEYVYGLIETLLPKAVLDSEKSEKPKFKMCELYFTYILILLVMQAIKNPDKIG